MREVGRLILPEVAELLEGGADEEIREALKDLHPADLAEVLDEMSPEHAARVIASLGLQRAARVFELLEEDSQLSLIEHLGRERLGRLVEEMAPDDRVDVIKALPERSRAAILALVAEEEREDIRKLAAYPEGTAGSLMTTDFVTVRPTLTPTETFDHLREEAQGAETVYWLYVVDDNEKLKGVISLRDIVLADPRRCIDEIMERDVITVTAGDDQEQVAGVFSKYDLLAVPVVDDEGRMLGIVTADDVLDVVEEEATEDIFRLAAAGDPTDTDYLEQSVLSISRRRVVWLLLLLVTGFLSALLLDAYEDVRVGLPVLVIFLPFLMGTGGNAGTQAATVVVRGLGTGELEARHVARVLTKEALVGITLGAFLGLLAAGWVYVTRGDLPVAMTVGVAMLVAAIVATSSGAVLPILFQTLGLDPALMSGPFITTVVDVAIIVLYFEIGRAILPPAAAAVGGG